MKTQLTSLALLWTVLLGVPALAQNSPNYGQLQDQGQLEDLVAPIALYPDPLLSQILPASTYPLEIVEAARIIHGKKDFSKIDAQNWDPSVKAVAHYPDVLKMMNERLAWTQQLGQAVIDQQQDVLKAVQTMRQRAQTNGNLQSTQQQVVEQSGNAIQILPYNPQVVYVPVYDPVAVYTVPVVEVYRPLISFSIGFPLGSWLVNGCSWPDNRIVYRGPYWGRDWNYVGYNDYNYTTNVYHTTEINRYYDGPSRPWFHDDRHGTPFYRHRDDDHHWNEGDRRWNDHDRSWNHAREQNPSYPNQIDDRRRSDPRFNPSSGNVGQTSHPQGTPWDQNRDRQTNERDRTWNQARQQNPVYSNHVEAHHDNGGMNDRGRNWRQNMPTKTPQNDHANSVPSHNDHSPSSGDNHSDHHADSFHPTQQNSPSSDHHSYGSHSTPQNSPSSDHPAYSSGGASHNAPSKVFQFAGGRGRQ